MIASRATIQALLLAGCTFLAACGGGDDGGSTVPPATGSISAIAGTGSVGSGIAADSAGNIFYSSGSTVFKRTAQGEVTPATTTTFLGPLGIAADGSGNLFVTERGENLSLRGVYAVTVRLIDRQGQVTRTMSRVQASQEGFHPLSQPGRVAVSTSAGGELYAGLCRMALSLT